MTAIRFEAEESTPEIELVSGGKTVIIKIEFLNAAKLKQLSAIEKNRKSANIEDQMNAVLEQIKILSPESKPSYFESLSFASLARLVQKMTELSIGNIEPEEKKSESTTKRKYSRSRKRGSP